MGVLGNLRLPLLQDCSRADDEGGPALDLYLGLCSPLGTLIADVLTCKDTQLAQLVIDLHACAAIASER